MSGSPMTKPYDGMCEADGPTRQEPLSFIRRQQLVSFASDLAARFEKEAKTPQEAYMLRKAFLLMVDGLY